MKKAQRNRHIFLLIMETSCYFKNYKKIVNSEFYFQLTFLKKLNFFLKKNKSSNYF
jgi:hypothetical protein